MNARRITAVALAAMLIAAVSAAPPRMSHRPSPERSGHRRGVSKAGGYFGERLINYGSGLCLQPEFTYGSYLFNGLGIIQTNCVQPDSGTLSPQWWRLSFIGTGSVAGRSGAFNLYHIVNELSGQCLDDRNGNTADRAPVQQWACTTSSNTMSWTTGRSVGGYMELINARSGKCLDIPGASLQPGVYVQQYRCTTTISSINSAQLFGVF